MGVGVSPIERDPKPYTHYIRLHDKRQWYLFHGVGRSVREWIEGREGEAQVEAAGSQAGAFEAKGEETGADTSSGEGAFAGGTSQRGIGLIELGGSNALIRSKSALLGEEERESILIFLKGSGGILDARRLNGCLGPPELEASDGPIENGGEGELEVVSEQ